MAPSFPFRTFVTFAVAVSLSCSGFGAVMLPGDAHRPVAGNMLLTDRVGTIVDVAEDDVRPGNIPVDEKALNRQIPKMPRGMSLAWEISDRIDEANKGEPGFEWFPGAPVKLQPYFKDTNQANTTAIQPGALFLPDPVSKIAQDIKTTLAKIGLTYELPQGFTFINLNGAKPGTPGQFYYWNIDARFDWAIFNARDAETAGWITGEVVGHRGLSWESRQGIPQTSAGTIINSAAGIFGPEGVWLQQLAWQQSFADGKFVVIAGQVDQSNYLDFNTYANNKNGQFIASPFVNSQVITMPYNNLGINLQWQPCDSFYATFGAGANNQLPGFSPFDHLTISNTSYVLEIGYVSKDFLGFGKGTYRLQPFYTFVNGKGRPGIAVNLQQQLGKDSPFGLFGRFGVTDPSVAIAGASRQVAAGFNVTGPFSKLGLVPKAKNDQLGIGGVWSNPPKSLQPVVHNSEYGIEAFYALQLTQTVTVLPDFQVIWNPATNSTVSRITQFAVQLNVTW